MFALRRHKQPGLIDPALAASPPLAGDWVKEVVGTLGGRGGGNPTMAQGTGPEVGKVDEALDVASSFASLKL